MSRPLLQSISRLLRRVFQPSTELYDYARELTREEIDKGRHREIVGGMWDELGTLQLEVMKSVDLLPHHQLLDLGCGCLRGGIHLARYLTEGHYLGIDRNASLLKAGRLEALRAEIPRSRITLFQSSTFLLPPANEGRQFDYLLAFSLFTHLPASAIDKCFHTIAPYFHSSSKMVASFFIVEEEQKDQAHRHASGEITTHPNRDPFHYTLPEIHDILSQHGFTVRTLDKFRHPRGQSLLLITRSANDSLP